MRQTANVKANKRVSQTKEMKSKKIEGTQIKTNNFAENATDTATAAF